MDEINGKILEVAESNLLIWYDGLGLITRPRQNTDFSQEQIQTAYEEKLRTVDENRKFWIELCYNQLLTRKKCEGCEKWVIPSNIYPNSLSFCSAQCLNSYKTKILAIQEIKNQLQQKGINRVEDLGNSLLELQALFPWNCQCDHPWTYEHHINNCLNTSEQIENFKNQYLNIILNIQPTNTVPENPQPTPTNQNSQQNNTNVSQNDNQNESSQEENSSAAPSDTSNQSTSYTPSNSNDDSYASSASSYNSSDNSNSSSSPSTGESSNYTAPSSAPSSSNGSYPSSVNNNSTETKPKDEEPETSQFPLPAEPTKTSTDKTSSEKINKIEEKVSKITNKPTDQISAEEIQNTLQELEQVNKDLEKEPTNSSNSSAQPEKAELKEKVNDLKVNLQIEAIKKIDNQQIQEARKLAKEVIEEHFKEKKITNYEEKELVKELEILTTSQAVAQHVQQIINQSKSISTSQNSSHQTKSFSYWPWIIGGGATIFLIGIIIWLLINKNKKKN